MKKFDDGTKVWIVEETTFPYNIVEGIIRQYRPQRLEGLELKYYSVYFEVDDKEYLCEEGQLFTDREHAAEDRKETRDEQGMIPVHKGLIRLPMLSTQSRNCKEITALGPLL